jgi:hypothetical protein
LALKIFTCALRISSRGIIFSRLQHYDSQKVHQYQ